MMIFANYKLLYLLLLVPLFPALYALVQWLRRRRIARFGSPELVKELMPSVSTSKGWVKISLFSLAFAFFVIGLARPQMGAKIKEQKLKGVEIMIALDVSNSMLAEDYSPNRLERAKLAISKLVDKLHDDRIGLVVFAGDAFVQLPVTTDYVSAKMFMNSITTESVSVQGTAIGSAIALSIKGFSAQSENSRAIVVITDGENHEDDPVSMARQAADMGIKVFTIGVGSPEGKPIPVNGELLKDKQGNTVVTRLDEGTLKDIAMAGGGAYVRAGNSEFGLDPIVDSIKKMDAEEFSSQVFEEYDEQYMYFFAMALLLLIIEMLIGDRKHRRQLFVLAALLLTIPAHAQPDRRFVRAGNRDFKKENYREADVDYRKAVLKDSTSVAACYNLANTCYRLAGGQQAVGNTAEAKKYYDSVKEQADASANAADYWFNVGDLALAQKDYKTAVDAFKRSLLKNPGDIDAKENYIYARKKLEDQQNQDQNQQNQDQNQDQNQNQDQDQDQNQNQDNKDQNQDQNKDNQDQNQDNKDQNQNQNQNDQNQNQNDQNQQQNQPQLSPQAAQQMLQAIQAKEKETQDKVNKEKALMMQSKQKDKNW